MKNKGILTFLLLMGSASFARAHTADTLSVDIIPDFSTVGYAHGDAPIPDYPIVETISPERVVDLLRRKVYSDTTSLIQAAIDRASAAAKGATVLLKDGVYNVGGVLFLDKDNVVLRGESREGTIIKCYGTHQKPAIVLGRCLDYKGDEDTLKFGNISGRRFKIKRMAVVGAEGRSSFGKHFFYLWTPATNSPTVKEKIEVTEDYCPVGRFWVEVETPSAFTVGDEVILERPHNDAWVSDVGMDKIASNGRDPGRVKQWNEQNMRMRWMRRITDIKGKKIYFDAPLVQSLDRNYGGGLVFKYKLKRVIGSGIDNLTLDAAYDPSIKNQDGVEIDENHAWVGVYVISCEDCFVRQVTTRHFGYSAVTLAAGSRCVTVEDCAYLEPVSIPTMARRYGFGIEGAELCLIKKCVAEKAAIGFGTNLKGGGPNVYTRCRGLNMRTGSGPHLHWSTGTLFDCCYNSAGFRVTDHGNSGTGHGWTGANTVFWNVETEGNVECESPWAAENTPSLSFASPHTSGRNYCIGLLGGKRVQKTLNKDFYGKPVEDYYMSLGYTRRPDAQWYPYVDYDEGGTAHVSLPCADAQSRFDWWPRLILTRFSDPLSLYQCQLEDRKMRERR